MAGAYKRKGDKRYTAWWHEWSGSKQSRRTRLAYSDKRESERFAQDQEDQSRMRKDGRIDAMAERLADHAHRPLADHVDDFEQYLIGKGNTAKRVQRVISSINDAATACEWSVISQLDAAQLQAHVTTMKASGLGHAAINGRLQAVKSFARWLVQNHRTKMDLLAPLKLLRKAEDSRRERRALDADELALLFEAAEQAGEFVTISKRYRKLNRKTGKKELKIGIRNLHIPHRGMLYRIAAGTGFRLSEIKSLTPRSFDLDSPTPCIAVEAAYSKRRRRDVQPIRMDLAEILKPWLAMQTPDETIWGNIPGNMAPIIAVDLKAAGLDVLDEDGKVVDFHALRHSYISLLTQAGVSPKVAQSLARHSSITLTMDRYSHVRLADEAKALEALPAIETETELVAATGTHDGTERAQHIAQQTEHISMHSGALPFSHPTVKASPPTGTTRSGNSLSTRTYRTPVHDDAPPFNGPQDEATHRTRTGDLSFTKAPLYQLS